MIDDERNHVRTVWARVRTALTESLARWYPDCMPEFVAVDAGSGALAWTAARVGVTTEFYARIERGKNGMIENCSATETTRSLCCSTS